MVERKFIDIDDEKEGRGLEVESFEQIVLKQIRETSIALSKEKTGGQIIERIVDGKKRFIPIPDTRAVIIESVKTLNFLLKPFIKKRLEDDFKKIEDEKEKIKKDLDEKEIKVGKRKGKMKEFDFIPPNHLMIKKKMILDCENSEKLFGVLVQAFHDSRMEIREAETEG